MNYQDTKLALASKGIGNMSQTTPQTLNTAVKTSGKKAPSISPNSFAHPVPPKSNAQRDQMQRTLNKERATVKTYGTPLKK